MKAAFGKRERKTRCVWALPFPRIALLCSSWSYDQTKAAGDGNSETDCGESRKLLPQETLRHGRAFNFKAGAGCRVIVRSGADRTCTSDALKARDRGNVGGEFSVVALLRIDGSKSEFELSLTPTGPSVGSAVTARHVRSLTGSTTGGSLVPRNRQRHSAAPGRCESTTRNYSEVLATCAICVRPLKSLANRTSFAAALRVIS